jgi:hypothetical protein
MKRKLLYASASVMLLLLPNLIFGQSAPNLGTTSTFALFSAVGAFNNTGASTVTGDVGTNAGAFNAFPPGVLVGQRHVADPASAQAATDVDVAYSYLSSVTCGTVIETTLGNGQVLTPDVYCLGAASSLNGDLILDGQGDPSKLFIFKINGALSTSTFSNVVLKNSASLCNVYWQINGQFELGDNSVFRGTIVANGALILLEGSSLFGRGLTREGAISLHNNVVSLERQSVAPTITANGPTTFCPGGSVILSGNTGGVWSNGATTPSITVTKAGDYFIKTNGGCGLGGTSNHIAVMVTSSSCALTGNGVICCQGKSTQICAPLSESSTYLWSNGATTNCITVSMAGNYSVTITTAEGCESVCSKTVTTPSAPVCNITGKSTICEGSATSLCATSGTGLTYLWSNGATSRCISVNEGGNYTVTVTKDKQHSSVCTKTVTETPAPSCIITGNSTIIKGETTQLCAPWSASSKYLWSTGETTNCITVSVEGAYSVTVTNAGGCKRTCKKIVKVTDAPSCSITGTATLCPGQSTQLCTPYGNGFTYLWSNGATTRCITVNAGGNYSVTVDKNESSSPTTCTKTVVVSSDLCCTLSGSNTICEGQSTQLCSPYGKGYTYLWNNGATTRCITVNKGGNYSATVTKDGNSTTCGKTVSVAPLACGITGSNTICQGSTSSLSGPSGTGYTYLWSTGETSRSIQISTGGTFSLQLTRNGCTNTCSKTVTVPSPTSVITGDNVICAGESTQLCGAYGYGYTYLWSTGATSRCLSVDGAGTFTLTVSKNGCTSTSTRRVMENPIPSCSITGNLFPTPGATTTLCAPEGLSSYRWSTGETTRCITVDCTGTYSLVTRSFECRSSCSVVVDYYSSTSANSTARSSSSANASFGDEAVGAESHIEVNAYPNPFYSTATIEFKNAAAGSQVVIELFSTTKDKVATLFDGRAEPGGLYKVQVNAANLPAGIYVYRITNGYQVISKKLILSR